MLLNFSIIECPSGYVSVGIYKSLYDKPWSNVTLSACGICTPSVCGTWTTYSSETKFNVWLVFYKFIYFDLVLALYPYPPPFLFLCIFS